MADIAHVYASYQSLNFNLNHSYKRVVKEFFSNFSLNANRTWSNSVVDMQIQNGNYLMTYIQHNTKSTNLTGRCWLSKGFLQTAFQNIVQHIGNL